MTPEAIYRQLARQIDTIPEFAFGSELTREDHKWLGMTHALVSMVDRRWAIGIEVSQGSIGSTIGHERSVKEIICTLHMAIAKIELQTSPSVQGSFIAVGQEFDAFSAVGRVFSLCKNSILIVDPYLDSVVVTDFVALAPENVYIRLLSDESGVKDSLAPAVKRWKIQKGVGGKRLAVKIAPPRSLHDRLLIVDGAETWIMTQSLKDFAHRSPASINRADADASKLKAEYYEGLWESSATLE